MRKALKASLDIRESHDWAACWAMLERMLSDRHDARPTHSLNEIELLAGRFPDKIQLFGAFDGDAMVAALVIFDCAAAVHAQYIASFERGRAHGGIDLIVNWLIEEQFADRRWFDLGISTTDRGRELNDGLARQKELFSARTVDHGSYELHVCLQQ